jgi:putative transposase
VHRHLLRLDRIWIEQPIFFVTTCTIRRRKILDSGDVAPILIEEWRGARSRHGWAIGRFVIMPDHVHFFCSAEIDAKPLSDFLGAWKQWTSKRLAGEVKISPPIWQAEFFDHVLRSGKSYGEKWSYVRQNPVRAGLATNADDWPWQREIEELRI